MFMSLGNKEASVSEVLPRRRAALGLLMGAFLAGCQSVPPAPRPVELPPPPVPPLGHNERDAQLAGLARELAANPGPVLLVGDLNTTPWSPAFANLLAQAQLDDPAQQFWPTGTWPAVLPVGRIWIDHVLAGHGATVTSRTVLEDVGSDHLPVVASVTVWAR